MYIFCEVDVGGPEVRHRMTDYRAIEPADCCCNTMRSEWGRLIDVSCVGYPRPENLVVSINIDFSMADEAFTSALPIHYCPWCGVALTLQILNKDAGQPNGGSEQ